MFKQSTITKTSLLLGLLLLINTIIGTVWFFQLTDLVADKTHTGTQQQQPKLDNTFTFKDKYMSHGIAMILIPWSIFCFLFIVLIKVVCFFFAEHKKRGQSHGRGAGRLSSYGQFNEEESVDPETDAVIGVYFKIMEQVNFRTVNPTEADSHEYGYMAEQRQCRLCLQYFKQEEALMKIPICEHILHTHCLRKWLIDFQKCPVCESNIVRIPQQNNKHENSLSHSGAINLQDAPGVRDFDSANQGRKLVGGEGLVSPASNQKQIVFAEKDDKDDKNGKNGKNDQDGKNQVNDQQKQ